MIIEFPEDAWFIKDGPDRVDVSALGDTCFVVDGEKVRGTMVFLRVAPERWTVAWMGGKYRTWGIQHLTGDEVPLAVREMVS